MCIQPRMTTLGPFRILPTGAQFLEFALFFLPQHLVPAIPALGILFLARHPPVTDLEFIFQITLCLLVCVDT